MWVCSVLAAKDTGVGRGGYPYQAGIGPDQPYFNVALGVMADTKRYGGQKTAQLGYTNTDAPVVGTWPVWEFYGVAVIRSLENVLPEVV